MFRYRVECRTTCQRGRVQAGGGPGQTQDEGIGIHFGAACQHLAGYVEPAQFGEPKYFAWVLRKDADTESFAKAINDALLKMTDDGRVKAIQEKWLGAAVELPREVPTK